jgi:deoxyribodipyrimidine photo-lyase
LSYNQARLRRLNAHKSAAGEYVLYWMQIYRRLTSNHALDYAARCARELGKPLVVYEGLRLDYPWASQRLHHFVLGGMQANAQRARALGLNYWPWVETTPQAGRGLLRRLAARAALVVTDDFPCFIVPEQSAALARAVHVPVFAVDSNSIVPLALLGAPVSAAAHLRPRVHKAFAEAWQARAHVEPELSAAARVSVEAPFEIWDTAQDIDAFVRRLPLDASVPPVVGLPGGSSAAETRLERFATTRLQGYAEQRSPPRAPQDGHASGLSPYLHFGHLSIEALVARVLATTGAWHPDALRLECRGKREGFFCGDADVNAFLDQAIVWRDVGFQWHWTRRADTDELVGALPAWAWASLRAHAGDARSHLYDLEQWEAGATHDPLWNAAQRELVCTGTMHNYLRMLWGKKVLEWSRTPEQAYRVLVHLNNKYALDGRNPNSYTGILWCFGAFDRPWAPERKVFGQVRYMSSENTARKFKLGPYLAYVESLTTPTTSGAR